MGCDGGTIPKRDELVKTKKKKSEASKDDKKAAKWNNCRLSQQPLRKPIVADLLGYLYNKEAILEYILDKSKHEGVEHIKSLKDVKEINLTTNPAHTASKHENGDDSANCSQWICPISGLEMNGSFKFYYVFSCGCVFSDRAYKSMQTSSSDLKCLKCEKAFTEIDLIVVNPNEEELVVNERRLKARKELKEKAKAEKNGEASSKKKIDEPSTSSKVDVPKSSSSNGDSLQKTNGKRSIDLVAKSEDKLGKSAIGAANAATAYSKDSNKKMKSIQDDPNHSDVFKSLFTSSEKAKNQQKAHWVTFNPQYF